MTSGPLSFQVPPTFLSDVRLIFVTSLFIKAEFSSLPG